VLGLLLRPLFFDLPARTGRSPIRRVASGWGAAAADRLELGKLTPRPSGSTPRRAPPTRPLLLGWSVAQRRQPGANRQFVLRARRFVSSLHAPAHKLDRVLGRSGARRKQRLLACVGDCVDGEQLALGETPGVFAGLRGLGAVGPPRSKRANSVQTTQVGPDRGPNFAELVKWQAIVCPG